MLPERIRHPETLSASLELCCCIHATQNMDKSFSTKQNDVARQIIITSEMNLFKWKEKEEKLEFAKNKKEKKSRTREGFRH